MSPHFYPTAQTQKLSTEADEVMTALKGELDSAHKQLGEQADALDRLSQTKEELEETVTVRVCMCVCVSVV